MTPTPRTDERANSWESIDGQWVNADFARQLERELAAKDAGADEIYKAAVDLAAKLEDDLAACREWSSKLADVADNLRADLASERALAYMLAQTLANVQGDYASTGAITTQEVDESLAAWKEARSGTV